MENKDKFQNLIRAKRRILKNVVANLAQGGEQ